MTLVSNVLSFGAGSIPRGINFGSGERYAGRQEMTKALALDKAARAKGCSSVDIPGLVDEFLGDGSMEKIVADQVVTNENSFLAEEAELKPRVR